MCEGKAHVPTHTDLANCYVHKGKMICVNGTSSYYYDKDMITTLLAYRRNKSRSS